MFKKSKISLFAFLSSLMIILVLLCSIGVHADGNISLVSKFNIPDSYISSDLGDLVGVGSTDTASNYETVYSAFYNSGMSVAESSYIDPDNYNNFILISSMAGTSSNWNSTQFKLYPLPTGSFAVAYNSNGSNFIYLYVPKDEVDSSFINGSQALFHYYSINVTYANGSTSSVSRSNLYGSETSLDDGVTYQVYNQTVQYIVNADIPIYNHDLNFDSIDELGSNINPNYSGGSSGESASNNLVLENADFSFNNRSFTAPVSSAMNSGSIYPSGNITFSFIPNEYQLSNSSQFNLVLSFYMDYDVNYQNPTGTANSPFETTGLTGSKRLQKRFIYNNDFIDIPLSNFISSGNSVSYSFEDILKNLSGYEATLLISKEMDITSYNKFNLYCTAFLDSGSQSSGNYTEWYNPINNKGYTTDKGALNNKNPYVNSDSGSIGVSTDPYSEYNVPGTAGSDGNNSLTVGGGNSSSSSSSSSGNSTVTVNNNPTFNNNSSSSSVASGDSSTPWLIDKLFGTGTVQEGSIGDTRIDSLEQTTGSNAWIEVMKSCFSFIPETFFSSLALYFGICLSILVVAFILRIVLDLL